MVVKVVLVVLVCIFVQVHSEEKCGILKNENNALWNVGIYKDVKNDNLELICLGTVVKHNVILTAAHCLCDQSGKLKNEEFYVSSRKLNKHTKRNENLEKVEKRNIFIHDTYKGGARKGDLAVIKLQHNLKNEDCTLICIDWDNIRPILEDGEKLRHSAWQNGNLKMTDVSYVDYDRCYYISSKVFKSLLMSDKICAKSARDTRGDIDDGAGLIYLNFIDNLWYLQGVVSAHDTEKSSVISYSNIILYLNWLSSILIRL